MLASDYPPDLTEVLVIDGHSKDGTVDIVSKIAAQDPRVRLLHNPDRNSSAALNIGLAAAKNEIVVRIDAHASYQADYIRESVNGLNVASDVGSAAGLQIACGEGFWQCAVAAAMAHPFGAGDAKYRHSHRAAWVDTVFLGAWRRDVARGIGGFDPAWKINADYEFNIRLRKAGYRLYLSPAIKSMYFPRRSFNTLSKQYFRYGYWRVRTIYAHPRYARWRQFVPPTFALAMLISLLMAPTTLWPLVTVAGAYAAAAVIASGQAASHTKWSYFPVLPFVFLTMHLTWGIGFLAGAIRWAPVAGELRRQKACSPSGPREPLKSNGMS
jgi:glycosyltransferase involved in cell wall biosynthesis